jgi:hypothetical protein
MLDFADLFSFLDDTPLGPILAVVVAIGIVLFLTGFLAFFVEVLIIVLALAITLAAKFLFRRPWFVEAVRERDGVRRRWAVVGWRRSGEFVDEVARSFEAGIPFRATGDARELGTSVEAGKPRG